MVPNAVGARSARRIQIGLLAAAAILLFILFALWSGVPAGERALPFWIGVGVLLAVLVAFAWATGHFLFRPLPPVRRHNGVKLTGACRRAGASAAR